MSYVSITGRWGRMALALLLIPGVLHSNDSVERTDLNGVHYETMDAISMDKELLVISPDKIKVCHLFTNHSVKPIQSTVLCPIPLDQKNHQSLALEDRKRVDSVNHWHAAIAGATSHDQDEQILWSNLGIGVIQGIQS